MPQKFRKLKWPLRIFLVIISIPVSLFLFYNFFIEVGTWPWNLKTLHPEKLPQFITHEYIDLDRVYEVSKFRSSAGHDNSDSFETCRSMKHYYQMNREKDMTTVGLYAPADGRIVFIFPEGEGSQVWIRPDGYPQFLIIIYHAQLEGVGLWSKVKSGQKIGHHGSNKTFSDMQISFSNILQTRMVSYFEVMTDEVFEEYKKFGIEDRSEFIIPREERDANPLTCKGPRFFGPNFVNEEAPEKNQVTLRQRPGMPVQNQNFTPESTPPVLYPEPK